MALTIMIIVIALIALFGQKTGISRTQLQAALVFITGMIGGLSGMDIPAEAFVDLALKIFDMGVNLEATSAILAVEATNMMMIIGGILMSLYRFLTKTVGGLFGSSAGS